MKFAVGVCCVAVLQAFGSASVTWTESDDAVVVQNGYTYLSFNKVHGSVDKISGDFSGNGAFSKNNLAEAFALKVSTSGALKTNKCNGSKLTATWVDQTKERASFRVKVSDGCHESEQIASEEWTISLRDGERAVTVSIRGHIVRDAVVDYVLHGVYTNSPSLYGLFPEGVVQMKDNTAACMGAPRPLSRAYALGDSAAIDVLRHAYDTPDIFNGALPAGTAGSRSTVVFKSAHPGFASGFEDVLFGAYPSASTDMLTAWTKSCWDNAQPVQVTNGTTYEFGLSFIPNNYDFPAYLLNDVAATEATVPFDQLRAYLTGIYASPVGCLQSFYDKQKGTIAPTISHPDVGYSPDTNFFDPDNFISLSAMLYSGDAYLLRQVRDVLHRTAETMCGIGKDQVDWYCNATVAAQTVGAPRAVPARGRKHKLFSTGRFNHAAAGSDGEFALL